MAVAVSFYDSTLWRRTVHCESVDACASNEHLMMPAAESLIYIFQSFKVLLLTALPSLDLLHTTSPRCLFDMPSGSGPREADFYGYGGATECSDGTAPDGNR